MDISVIIVNYMTKILTENAINSINNNVTIKKFKYEIIVIDNDSSDDSYDYLKNKKFRNCRIIKSKENNGFGYGNNLGVSKSSGKYILFINSDTISNELDFENLLNLFNKNNDIGILSCKILNEDSTIQSLGFEKPTVLNEIKLNQLFWNYNILKKIRFRKYNNRGFFEVDWVSGCMMLLRREDFIKSGSFDEKIFMYAEDLDLCYRIKRLNKKIYIYDRTYIYHLHGKSSSKKNITIKTLLKKRENYYYVIKKNNLCRGINIIKMSYYIHACLLISIKRIKGGLSEK